MEEKKEYFDLLDMMIQPVFCVKESRILRANAAARQMLLREGEDIRPLLQTGAEEYAAFRGGCLYLTLSIAGQLLAASVRRLEDTDLFELDTENASALQALALASGQLRGPLSGALSAAAELLETQEDPQTLRRLAGLNRELYRMLRLLGNMSDAGQTAFHCRPQTMEAGALFREIFDNARSLVEGSGLELSYQGLNETVYCLLDKEQLERAVLNLLSNAMKFTPKNGRIAISLTRRGRSLVLTLQDTGNGIAQDVLGSLFRRHLRQPGIEDSRFGIGLGLRIVHTAALSHGGTLLITRGEEGGTRVMMTLAIRQNPVGALCSPIFQPDYTGGFHHGLVELSDSLKPEFFEGK